MRSSPPWANIPPGLQSPPFRLHTALLHEMTDGVQPLAIPGQDPAPDLKRFVGLDFSAEITVDRRQSNAHACPFPEFGTRLDHPTRYEAGQQV